MKPLPIWVLTAVLKRIRVDDKGITADRAALIRIILNRNNKNGGFMMKESLDERNDSTAYVCGRIFSVLEGIQRAALGSNINAGIRERFFSFASTNPSSAFGRLMKMSQNHLSKLKGEKPGLAVILDKEMQNLFAKIKGFPVVFSLEEQGQFAIGYYHQKHDTFKKAAENKELKDALEHIEEKGE
jgi:CRISPR-associated protein Csd1